MIYGFSPSIIPAPRDWPATCTICGYWFLDSAMSWEPPADLQQFVAERPAPLYIGFGSMASEDPAHVTGMMLEALRRTGQRAIIASGWGGLRGGDLPPAVYAVESVPHEWLFPRIAGAIHHGGAGTTAAALRAGIPSFIVPFFADQFFWGNRLASLGLSPKPVAHRQLTVGALEKGIMTLVGSPGMAEKCRAASVSIQAERGVERAVEAIDLYLRSVIRHKIH